MAIYTGRDGNRILASLTPNDALLLSDLLTTVDLASRRKIDIANKRIEFVHFIDEGMLSVVATGTGSGGIEVGLIGREGFSGVPAAMGTERWPFETHMQIAGSARRIAVKDLSAAMEASATLRATLLSYCHAFFIQVCQTAVANGRDKIEQRLARWLCMAHDRINGDELLLTHEFLAVMLGVRRPGVTLALEQLASAGTIDVRRGRIAIVDREKLEKRAGPAYGPAEAELARLFERA